MIVRLKCVFGRLNGFSMYMASAKVLILLLSFYFIISSRKNTILTTHNNYNNTAFVSEIKLNCENEMYAV